MANRINYERVMEETIAALERDGQRPQLLLHACCAPCSTAVLERLMPHFALTLYFYNPNILPWSEYEKRLSELKKLLAFPEFSSVGLLVPGRDEPAFEDISRGAQQEPEGGARCTACFRLRLEYTARAAAVGGRSR